METLEDKLFEHPSFVWLEHSAVNEILDRRKPNSCEALTIYNNLLRWSLYQLDRSACCDLDEGRVSGADIPVTVRLEWIGQCRNGDFDHVTVKDMDKYLSRGLERMPWTEMSQSDYLVYVVNARVTYDEIVFPNAVKIMEIVVNNPDRLHKSAFANNRLVVANPPISNPGINKDNKSKIAALFSKDNLKTGSTTKPKTVLETTRG